MVLYIVFLIMCMANNIGANRILQTNPQNLVNVIEYGAVGNAQRDNSQAFMKAWEIVCTATGDNNIPTLFIPKGNIFLLKPVKFEGPCKSGQIHVQVLGDIIAPGELSEWSGDYSETWLRFSNVSGLIVNGDGLIDGQGINRWSSCPEMNGCSRPTALSFLDCENVQLSGLKHKDSPKNHISISECNSVTIFDLHISAPETSPNTDGIDISHSTNIQINNCNIATGDDCIAINTGSSLINISGVICGPGHGISIGSLGKDDEIDTVEDVHVKNCSFIATQNGVRIKTWQGGSGYARKISFENITFTNTKNPIIIDQFYCPSHSCNFGKTSTSTVEVSDVSYIGVYGTSIEEDAIKLNCDTPCTNLLLDHVNITSSIPEATAHASCQNAHGNSSDTFPLVKCLLP